MIEKSNNGLGAEELTIMPLGAGAEVGRSCIIVKFKGKTIMVYHAVCFDPDPYIALVGLWCAPCVQWDWGPALL